MTLLPNTRLNFQQTIATTKAYTKPVRKVWQPGDPITFGSNYKGKNIATEDLPYVVYRIFGINDELLYVGITNILTNRLHQHKRKPWAKEAVEYSFEEYRVRSRAAEVEAELIRTLHPKYNVEHSLINNCRSLYD